MAENVEQEAAAGGPEGAYVADKIRHVPETDWIWRIWGCLSLA